jgi:hypothetical protein
VRVCSVKIHRVVDCRGVGVLHFHNQIWWNPCVVGACIGMRAIGESHRWVSKAGAATCGEWSHRRGFCVDVSVWMRDLKTRSLDLCRHLHPRPQCRYLLPPPKDLLIPPNQIVPLPEGNLEDQVQLLA